MLEEIQPGFEVPQCIRFSLTKFVAAGFKVDGASKEILGIGNIIFVEKKGVLQM